MSYSNMLTQMTRGKILFALVVASVFLMLKFNTMSRIPAVTTAMGVARIEKRHYE